jgi:cytochrome bd-type quinol oxidase subunit 2
MKQRSIGKMVLFLILTLGIYRLFWLAKTRKELESKTDLKTRSVAWLFLPFVFIVLGIGFIITDAARSTNGLSEECKSISINSYDDSVDYSNDYRTSDCNVALHATYLVGVGMIYIGALLALPLSLIFFWPYSKAVEKLTNHKTSFPVALLILLVVPDGIDILIMQDTYNKYTNAPKEVAAS